MNSIFDYIDHLQFIQDRITILKKESKGFSHRSISRNLDLNSSAVYNQIIKGKFKLSDTLIKKFEKILKLTTKEDEYFEILGHLDHSETSLQKTYSINRLVNFIKLNPHLFTQDNCKLIFDKYYKPLYEILSISCSNTDYYKELKSYLKNPEIVSAILKEIASPTKDKKNRINKKEILIREYVLNSIDLAKMAEDKDRDGNLSMISFSFKASESEISEIIEKTKKYCENIIKVSNSGERGKKEHLVNIQFFPI